MKITAPRAGTVRERVGLGTAEVTYDIPVAKPADVVNRAADPLTLQAYSAANQEQVFKIVVGLGAILLTWVVVGGLALVAYYNDLIEPSTEVVVAVYGVTVLLLAAVSWRQWVTRYENDFDKIILFFAAAAFVILVRSVIKGQEEQMAVLLLALALSVFNPWGTPRVVSGLRSYRHIERYDEVLYNNHRRVYVGNNSASSLIEKTQADEEMGEPLMVGKRDNGSLVFPSRSGQAYLYRHIEDFCFVALKEGPGTNGPTSGLSRSNMLGKTIGPQNNTVPGRPVSLLKVTQNVYNDIISGLYATGLVEQGANRATVWSKIKEGTEFECGWDFGHIQTTLLQFSSKAV